MRNMERMRNATTCLATVACMTMVPGTATSQDAHTARVDSILAAYYQADGPGAAVAVVQDGRIVLERARGRAHLEYDVPITPATVFHVASVSKQFATFAVVLLEQQGRLSLDDDIRVHLPELHDFGHRITVRHLANHTSGIRDQWELLMMAGWRIDDVITRDQIMAMMRRQRELNFEPGSEYLYSNMGYSLLAEIVERTSGMPFDDYLRQHVFEPLGMTATHVHNDHERIVPGRAYSYRPRAGQGGQAGPGGQAAGDNAGSAWRTAVLSYANQGATSLFTTTGDLARWLVNFETGAVGGAAGIEAMRQRAVLTSGDTIPYALAIQRGQHQGRTHWGHGGSDAGFRSHVLHFPEERLGVVVLSNTATTNASALALAVADVFLDPPDAVTARAVAAGTAPPATAPATPVSASNDAQPARWEPTPAELAEFTGDYYSPELGVVYSVAGGDDGLVVTHHRLPDMRLVPATETDAFRVGNRQFRFLRSPDGALAGFRLTGSRVRNVAFIRLGTDALPAGIPLPRE